MGYCFSSGENTFKIKQESIGKVYKELLDFAENNKEIVNNWDWCSSHLIIRTNDVFECFDNMRWALSFNNNGDIDQIEFVGDKLGNDFDFFQVFAKYVEDSYIECTGEDGEIWRYVFKDGEVKEAYPKIIWDEA